MRGSYKKALIPGMEVVVWRDKVEIKETDHLGWVKSGDLCLSAAES